MGETEEGEGMGKEGGRCKLGREERECSTGRETGEESRLMSISSADPDESTHVTGPKNVRKHLERWPTHIGEHHLKSTPHTSQAPKFRTEPPSFP
jgi:hypothetical protein